MLYIGILRDVACSFSKSLSPDTTFFHFNFAKADPSFSSIFDSAMSSPARYLEEMLTRLSLIAGGADYQVFLFNPFYEFSKLEISATLSALSRGPVNSVLVDRQGRSIGYYFGEPIPDDRMHFLKLLSTSRGRLDASLIGHLFETEATVQEVSGFEINPHESNGFDHFNAAVFEWMSSRALSLLEKGIKPDTKNMMAVMPHHAGDVTFITLAFKWTESPIYAVAINNSYVSIARFIDPEIPVVSLPGYAFFREPNAPSAPAIGEWQYFLSIKDLLPADMFLVYMRPSRDYNVTVFHLIDHWAFAFGRRLYDIGDSLVANLPAVSRATLPAVKRGVLIHLDAGWPLKIYPGNLQQELVDRLSAHGFEVTVLAGKAPLPLSGCRVVQWDGLEKLSDLMNTQSLVIGMDSFPVHWASFALGIPVVTVFSSTQKQNSHPHPNSTSVSLDEGFKCNPCLAWERCPVFGGNICRNFSSPAEIARIANDVVENESAARLPVEVYKMKFVDRCAVLNFPDDPSYKLPTEFIQLRLAVSKLTVGSRVGFALYLARQFISESRNTGIMAALKRAARFAFRRIGGRARKAG